jgi:hypothetical protein
MVTTLPAKAGSFWPEPEASALIGASRATRAAPRYVNARRPDPGLLEQASTFQRKVLAPGFLPSRGEVVHAISTAEHLTGPKPPSARDTSYPRAFPVEPPQHIVHVKVPSSGTTKPWVGQVLRAARAARRWRDPHSPPA